MSIIFQSSPLSGPLISFGRFEEWRENSKGGNYQHKGIDLSCIENTLVYAVANGVATVGRNSGHGLYVEISHEFGAFKTKYAHLNRAGPRAPSFTRNAPFSGVPAPAVVLADVPVGNTFLVKAGDVIGLSGGNPTNQPNAGASKGPHLHFELLSRTGTPLSPDEPLRNVTNQKEIPFIGRETRLVNNKVEYVPRAGSIKVSNALTLSLSGNRDGRRPSVITNATPAISPYIASLDSFHPRIQYELTKRAYATETVQSYMPFVKLTSLSKVLKRHLEGNADDSNFSDVDVSDDAVNDNVYCPSLGPHGEPSLAFEDIYTPQSGRSVVGYATALEIGADSYGKFIRKKVVVEGGANETDAPNIPMPGIISMSTERSTAGPMGVRGGLFKANIKILAHSVGQLNALLVYFLRPATRVILEFGRRSSNANEEIFPFDWNRTFEAIKNDLQPLILGADQQKFIEKHVYGSNGNYEIFIGYVVNFKLNYTGKNTYEIDLTVHSIQQYEVPVKLTGAQSLCKNASAFPDVNKVIDITAYFNPDEKWGDRPSFETLLTETIKGTDRLQKYQSHVIKLLGESSNASTGHLISWQYFTDIVMNDIEYGLPSVFQLLNTDGKTRELLFRSMLAPFTSSYIEYEEDKVVNAQVSYHPSLLSTDPSTMVIYNPSAQSTADIDNTINIVTELNIDGITTPDIYTKITENLEVGIFTPLLTESSGPTVGSLYNGVWINTNAIKEAFGSADTVTSALSRLLSKMNAATEGFWNLQLLSDDVTSPGIHVIDAGLSKTINKDIRPDTPTKQFDLLGFADSPDKLDKPRYLYQFNRKTQRFQTDDVGSELLDIKLEASLPQVIAIQAIAGVGGVGQRGTWEAIRVDELKKITLFPNIFPACETSELASAPPRQNDKVLDDKIAALQTQVNKDKTLFGQFKGLFTGGFVGMITGGAPQNRRAELAKLSAKKRPALAALARNYLNSFGKAFILIEYDKIDMLNKISKDTESSAIHPFNSSNLTKTVVDLTLPGIGGIQLFQSFTVARVPNILDRGYYIVTKVNNEFTPDRGWITKIQGRFRYKPTV